MKHSKLAKIAALCSALMLSLALFGCGTDEAEPQDVAQDVAAKAAATPDEAKALLIEGNDAFVANDVRSVNTSQAVRTDTTENGQHPYAVVITCSDSRVPAEHVFNAGIGELFVIRTAGNVIGDFELGSVEYGAEHLGCPLVVVLGHTNCGAVDAALNGGAHGNIELITDEILANLDGETDPRAAEIANANHSIEVIESSEIMAELIDEGAVEVVGAIYDIESGKVTFLDA